MGHRSSLGKQTNWFLKKKSFGLRRRESNQKVCIEWFFTMRRLQGCNNLLIMLTYDEFIRQFNFCENIKNKIDGPLQNFTEAKSCFLQIRL